MNDDKKPESKPEKKAKRTRPSLEYLLADVTQENHPEIDFGPPVGKERFWEDDAGNVVE